MFTKILACSILAALFCLSLAPAVFADNITITSGSFSFSRPDIRARFNFSGADFQIAGGSDVVISNIMGACFFGPCTSGNLSSVTTGSDIGGSGSYQGNPFALSITGSPGTAQASLFLNSVSFVIPTELLDAGLIQIIAPFTLVGFTQIAGGPGSIGPDLRLSGQGGVTVLFARTPSGGFAVRQFNYEIGNSPSGTTITAVPEPATFLLVAVGLSGLLVRLRR